jgi:hypothetical protein
MQLASQSAGEVRSGESAVQRRDFEGEGTVGLVDFKDAEGVSWRVWQVETPAASAHLMDPSYRSGWLVFEREDGTARRRLQQVPEDWSSLSPERLSQLCAAASPVVAGRNTPTGPQFAWPRPEGDVRSDR